MTDSFLVEVTFTVDFRAYAISPTDIYLLKVNDRNTKKGVKYVRR